MVDYPELKWKRVKDAKKYVVQISADRDFGKILINESVDEPKYSWNSVKPGLYFWRVAARAEKMGPFSEIEPLSVKLPAPKLKAKYRYEVLLEGDKQVLNWPFVPLAEKYLVQVSQKRNLASNETLTVGVSKFDLPKKPVFILCEWPPPTGLENHSVIFSTVAAVSVEPVASLDAPMLKLPKSGAAAVARNGRLSISFEWTKVPRAERYVIELSMDEDFSEVIKKIPAVGNSHVMKKIEAVGQVYWRVRAESRDGVSSWSEPSHFEVRK